MIQKLLPISEDKLISNWKEDLFPLVSITCIAYNHEDFIEDCLNSMLAQKTSFPFEIIIHDDASTDKTQEIIRKYIANYPKIIIPILQKDNHWKGKGINATTTIVWPSARGKYIAWCEGDDYWTDDYKLQKQVDFLENNKDFNSCFTNVNTLKDNKISTEGALKKKHKKDSNAISVFDELWIPTLTFVFRKKSFLDIPQHLRESSTGDLFLFYLLAQNGKIKYLDFISGIYRQHEKGIWAGSDKVSQINISILTFKRVRSGINNTRVKKILEKKIDNQKIALLKYYYKRGEKQYFFKTFLRLIFQRPSLLFKRNFYFFISE